MPGSCGSMPIGFLGRCASNTNGLVLVARDTNLAACAEQHEHEQATKQRALGAETQRLIHPRGRLNDAHRSILGRASGDTKSRS